MTTRPSAAHARDWPLPQRVWELFVWLVLIAVLSIAARESYGAERAWTGGARFASSSSDAGARIEEVDLLSWSTAHSSGS